MKYNHKGFVSNAKELAELTGADMKSIHHKIYRMRQQGKLFEIYWEDPIEPPNLKYSKKDEERILRMYKHGCSVSEMAKILGRTESSLYNKIHLLRKESRLSTFRKRKYTEKEIDLLLRHIKFDENGYVFNIDELVNLLHRSKNNLFRKICVLRKSGVIEVKPDHSKASQNWYDTMKRQIEISYQLYLSTQKKPTSVAPEVSNKQNTLT